MPPKPPKPPAAPAAKAAAPKAVAKPAAKPAAPKAAAKPAAPKPAAKPAAPKPAAKPKAPKPFSVEGLSQGMKKGAPTGGGPRPAPRAQKTGKLGKAGTAARGLAGAGGTSTIQGGATAQRGTAQLRNIKGLGSRFISAARAGGRSLLRGGGKSGKIGAALALGSAGYEAYRAFQDSGSKPDSAPAAKATPAPKPMSMPKPASKPASKATPMPKPPRKSPKPAPTPFANSDVKKRQDEFLKQYKSAGFKPTQQETAAYQSIMAARSDEGRRQNLVGVGIVGRRKPRGMK